MKTYRFFTIISFLISLASVSYSQVTADFTYTINASTGEVTFADKSQGTIDEWNWDLGDGSSTADQHPINRYKAGRYQVCLIVRNTNTREEDKICKFIQVPDPNDVRAAFSFFVKKQTGEVLFTDKSQGPVDKWEWDLGDGSKSSSPDPVNRYKPGTYSVCLSVTNKNSGNNHNICKDIVVPEPVTIKADFAYNVDASTGEVVFTDKSLGNVDAWNWNFGDGNTSTGQNPVNRYKPGKYSVCLVAINKATGVKDKLCRDIVVPEPDLIEAGFNITIEQATGTAHFEDNSKGNIDSWNWSFGDGDTSNEQNPKNVYKPGIYTICLSVMNSNTGNKDKTCKEITIKQPAGLTASFTFQTDNSTGEVTFQDASTGEIDAYFWNFGDGAKSNEQNPVHTYEKSGLYPVCLIVTNKATGNTNRFCMKVEVQIKIPLTADFEYKIDQLTGIVNFHDLSTGPVTNWKWDFGDNNSSANQITRHQYLSSGTYNVCLTIENKNTNTRNSVCKEIKIDRPQQVNSLFSFSVDNPTKTVSFTDLSTGPVDQWLWNFGNGQNSQDTEPVHVFSATGNYKVCLTAANQNSGVKNTSCQVVEIQDPLFVTANFNYEISSTGKTVEFFDISKGNISKRIWDFGDGNKSEEDSPVSHTYSEFQTYDVCLEVVDENNDISDFICKEIPIRDNETLNAYFGYKIDNENLSVSFNNLSKGEINRIVWDFGDGNSSNKENPSHTYQNPGIYKICLSIFDVNGNESFSCRKIELREPGILTANFNAFIDNNILEVKFNDASIGNITDWSWDYGDGTGTDSQNAEHTYTKPGKYRVCLYVANEKTNDESFYCQPVIVGNANQLSPEFEYIADHSTLEIKFNDLSKGNITDWQWDFGDGSNSPEPNPSHSYATAGKYRVCLKILNNESGNENIYCEPVILTKPGRLTADFDFFINHDESEVKFTDKSSGNPTHWQWEYGDGNSETGPGPMTHKYKKPGKYKVCLRIKNEDNGTFDETCYEMNILAPNQTLFVPDFDYFVDNSDKTVKFINTTTGSVTDCFWRFGDGQFSKECETNNQYEKEGIYEACLSVKDQNTGESGNVCKKVEVFGTNVLPLSADFSYYIEPGTNSVIFRDKSNGVIDEWYWKFGDGNFSSDQHPENQFDRPGVYIVCLSVRNRSTGQTDKICREIFIKSGDLRAGFTFFVDNQNKTVEFKDKSLGDVSKWYWEFGDGDFGSGKTPTHGYDRPGLYPVTLTVFNELTEEQASVTKKVAITEGQNKLFDADFSFFVDPVLREVQFTDKSTGDISAWYWIFGDGDIAEIPEPTHVFDKPGIYEVCLIVSNETGQKSRTCQKLQVGEQECRIQADFSYFVDSETNTISLQDNSYGPVVDWYWNFGDGNTDSGEKKTEHIFESPGLYKIGLSVIDETGNCSDREVKKIQVGTLDCKAEFEYSVDMSQGINTVNFDNTSSGDNLHYFWQFGDGTTFKDVSPTHDYKKGGMYVVKLTVSNRQTQCFDVYTDEIQVGSILCKAKFSVFVEKGSYKATFKNEELGESTNLYWEFGDGSFSSESNPVHVYKAPGVYNVSLSTLNEDQNCMDYFEENVIVGEIGRDCEADFAYQIDEYTVNFFDNSSGSNLTYVWNFNDRTKSEDKNPVHTFDKPGVYNVCLTVANQFGVSNTTCKRILINKECKADFTFTTNLQERTVIFEDVSIGEPDTWEWNFGNGSRSSEQNPTIEYSEAGFYKVGLRISNSETSCRDKHIKIVNVSSTEKLFADFEVSFETTQTKSGGYPADFLSSAFGKPGRAVWDFGDSEIDTSSFSPSHVFSEPGIYDVCLTVSDPNTGETSEITCKPIEVGEPLIVTGSIGEINVYEDAEQKTLELDTVFAGYQEYEILVTSNTNDKLVKTTIDETRLLLDFTPDASGESTIIIEAKTTEESVTDEFTVNVIPVDDPPVVAKELADIIVMQNTETSTRDLTGLFTDIDNDDNEIELIVQNNSNPALLTAAIEDNSLEIIYLLNQYGSAEITITGISVDQSVSQVLNVTVEKSGTFVSDVENNTCNIYPNPFKDQLIIQSNLETNYRIDVYVLDMHGKKHIHEFYTGGKNAERKIHTTYLRPGIYFLKVVFSEGNNIYKFVKY